MYIIEARVMDENESVHVESVEQKETAMNIAEGVANQGFFYHEDEERLTYYPADSIMSVTIRKGRDDVRD